MKKLTVILPAAGTGSRLDISHSKEILRVGEYRLIDYTLRHFAHIEPEHLEFVVVLRRDKTDVSDYLSDTYSQYKFTYVVQQSELQEYTGAILSARHLLGENNLVVLPDTYMILENTSCLYSTTLKKLEISPFVWWYQPENNGEILTRRGALQVNCNRVTDYVDKPVDKLERFNGYWTAWGFTDTAFHSFIDYFHSSTLGRPSNFYITGAWGAPAVEIVRYYDLGTWPEINRFISHELQTH